MESLIGLLHHAAQVVLKTRQVICALTDCSPERQTIQGTLTNTAGMMGTRVARVRSAMQVR